MIITKNIDTYRNIIRKHLNDGTDAMTLARTAKVCYGLNIGASEFVEELHMMTLEGELEQVPDKVGAKGYPVYRLATPKAPERPRMTTEQIMKDLGF